MIATDLSPHAERQAQRRGISFPTIDLILRHSDRSQKLPGHARALWISKKGRACLISCGFNANAVDRTRGVRLIVGLDDDTVLTVEHMLARRRWA